MKSAGKSRGSFFCLTIGGEVGERKKRGICHSQQVRVSEGGKGKLVYTPWQGNRMFLGK